MAFGRLKVLLLTKPTGSGEMSIVEEKVGAPVISIVQKLLDVFLLVNCSFQCIRKIDSATIGWYLNRHGAKVRRRVESSAATDSV